MKRILTSEQMRLVEKAFMEKTGYPSLLLMEHAAQAVAQEALAMARDGAAFFCGPGNNGGDGYAAARLFWQAGRRCEVFALSDPEKLRGDALVNARLCRALGIPIRAWEEGTPLAPDCSLVVDALFGTGLSRPLEGVYAAAVRFFNGCDLPVLAVDMPSGTPELMTRAQATVTFHRAKLCHMLFPGRENAGRLVVAPIGLPEDEEGMTVLEEADVASLLPPRRRDAHKGTCGHVLVAAGSPGMAGAAALCANAAMRAGAGLCTLFCAKETMPILQTLAPCATCRLREETRVEDALAGTSAVAAGPGLGMGRGSAAVLEALLRAKETAQVWDADALTYLSQNPAVLGERFIITPHPGEASRLLGIPAAQVAREPVDAALALSEKYACTALVKGATTVIAFQGQCALNTAGTQGMATGGSGDVLTGIIAGLLAQGVEPFLAARLGALLHGLAGERAAQRLGVRSMLAQDLLGSLCIE